MMHLPITLSRRLCAAVLLLLVVLASFTIATGPDSQVSAGPHQLVYETKNQYLFHVYPPPISSKSPSEPSHASSAASPLSHTPTYTPTDTNILHNLHGALSTMQDHYFELWLGKWATANDWTGAVMGTYLSATLSSLSRSIEYTMPGTFDKTRNLDVEAQMVENEINKYFAQTISYYFGEDHFAMRMQAYDDMLWVVLGWLEATQFVEEHSGSHYAPETFGQQGEEKEGKWHASQFVPAFAHRARVFYELAEKGWDWRLCGGGMTWNPRLLPYKNAITNQLFISASIAMYLHFPGDENCSPFLSQLDDPTVGMEEPYNDCDEYARGRYDAAYLANAKNGYDWLRNSGMINDQGLYVDGFHIAGYRQNRSKTTCDERNEMIYTYNQGVILSGLRGLWEATGNVSYLEDGHALVRNVIRATGWTHRDMPSFTAQENSDNIEAEKTALPTSWSGLGSSGVLTELCDPSSHCNQDGQTFKGVFFHHLTTFCTPLPSRPVRVGKTHAASRETAMLHRRSCSEYTSWVVHNAQAALRTRDEHGRFGSWWGAPDTALGEEVQDSMLDVVIPEDAQDYRNQLTDSAGIYTDDGDDQTDVNQRNPDTKVKSDLNDRGRGRTVETQGSGLAVVRAMWEFLRRAEASNDLDL